MAKTQNPIVGASSGKMANVIFSRSFGSNILRSKALVVRNPNTDAQRAQRSFFSTIGLMVKQGKLFFEAAFANDVQTRSTYSTAMYAALKAPKLGASARLKYPNLANMPFSNGYLPAGSIILDTLAVGATDITGTYTRAITGSLDEVQGDIIVMAVVLSGPFSQSISNVDENCMVEASDVVVDGTGTGNINLSVNISTPLKATDIVYLYAFQIDNSLGIGRNAKTQAVSATSVISA